MTLDRTPISSIHVGTRRRRDLGDIESLMRSISSIGLLHPVVLNSEGDLIVGGRRLEAVKRLGWETVPAITATSLDDVHQALLAERDENTCREGFTLKEAIAMAQALEPLEKRDAAERQGQRTDQHPGKFPTSSAGRAADKVAAAVGMSRPTLEKAKTVVEKGTPELVAAVDRREVSVSAAAAVATRPPERQRELVAAGRPAIVEEAKKIRETSAARPLAPLPPPPPLDNGMTPHQAAKESPAVKWSGFLYRIWEHLNSIRANGGILVLAKSWSAEHRAGYARQLRELRALIDKSLEELETSHARESQRKVS